MVLIVSLCLYGAVLRILTVQRTPGACAAILATGVLVTSLLAGKPLVLTVVLAGVLAATGFILFRVLLRLEGSLLWYLLAMGGPVFLFAVQGLLLSMLHVG